MTVGNKINSSKHTAGGFKWDPSNDKSNLEQNQRNAQQTLLVYRYKAAMQKKAQKNERS